MVRSAASLEDLDALLSAHGPGPCVLHFWADFYANHAELGQAVATLQGANPAMLFVNVEAERVPAASERYGVRVVPTFVFLRAGQPEGAPITGARTADVAQRVAQMCGLAVTAPPAAPQAAAAAATTTTAAAAPPADGGLDAALRARLDRLVRAEPVMLFMKGSPDEPQCGFSRTMVGLLRDAGVRFGSFDILGDPAVRSGIKLYHDFPTFPQLVVNGELVGGLDIVKEMVEEGGAPLAEQLGLPSLQKRLGALVQQKPVMLFMKGEPAAPRCGFSRTIVGLLNDMGVSYGHFDILSDEEVRQGLKDFVEWRTYPMLFANGELVGGLDIVQEMKETGELAGLLSSANES